MRSDMRKIDNRSDRRPLRGEPPSSTDHWWEAFALPIGARCEWRLRHPSMEGKFCRREVWKTERRWDSYMMLSTCQQSACRQRTELWKLAAYLIMANVSQYRYIDDSDTYVISKFSMIMDMCATKQNIVFFILQRMNNLVNFLWNNYYFSVDHRWSTEK